MTDRNRLKLFLRRIEELKATTLVQFGYESGFTLKGSSETGAVSFHAQSPSEELFKSLLVSLRHFWLKKEPTYIYSVYSTCHRILTNDTHRQYLSKSRALLDESLKSTGIQLRIDLRDFTLEYVWDVYINGLYFHNDSEKMSIIDKLSEFERMVVKNELYGFVNRLCKQVLYVGRIVAYAVEHNEMKPTDELLNPERK